MEITVTMGGKVYQMSKDKAGRLLTCCAELVKDGRIYAAVKPDAIDLLDLPDTEQTRRGLEGDGWVVMARHDG